MLEHWLIELVGHVSGLSDAQLKQVEKSLPATKGLIDLLNKARPIIERAQNLYVEAEPLIEQAKREWQTVGPAAQILIDVIHIMSIAVALRQRPLKQYAPRLTRQ
jgi:hypothetical protein